MMMARAKWRVGFRQHRAQHCAVAQVKVPVVRAAYRDRLRHRPAAQGSCRASITRYLRRTARAGGRRAKRGAQLRVATLPHSSWASTSRSSASRNWQKDGAGTRDLPHAVEPASAAGELPFAKASTRSKSIPMPRSSIWSAPIHAGAGAASSHLARRKGLHASRLRSAGRKTKVRSAASSICGA